MQKILSLLLIVAFLSCGPMKNTGETAVITSVSSNAVVFMSFQIQKDTIGKRNSIALLHTVKTTAKLKNQSEADVHSPNFLTAKIYFGDRLLQTIIVPHPMFVHSEYADESGKLASKDVVLDQAEFFIRFQQNGANHIRIFETLIGKNKTALFQIKF
ncbi:hypothetical protein FNO01nite_27180 [Flavobacterium noncentrifugens]|uniref:Lipoprotein n=1 Tax=Flavobacterium noncentrifugens TaxID=1128970 RepID=A0A1G9CIB8_9FLAO|nr:hypothetical protein [Flavobacterium noncentrifugens]GEP52046.1 hypothetical protein FNO01nite_27180 [Flavobacterium noncentrifugens]SDK51390.1 hypothetical protein SAMN04487935_3538 [Flavobacterium noncentrifugens]